MNIATPNEKRLAVRPAVDIFQNDDAFTILADLPGVGPDDLAIDFENERLTLVGKRDTYDFRRVFTVPHNIDTTQIGASLEAGVLTLTLPRHERTKPRRISIKSNG